MINKTLLGKRLSACRRRKAISQTELSEILGVTPQAVSKWECGNAVPEIEFLLKLSKLYSVSINELLEGHDLLFELTEQMAEADGIAYFVPKAERDYNVEWAAEIVRGAWIKRNWREANAEHSVMDEVGRYIAKRGGIVLEIGVGPGGGFMPYILKQNADATVIISDLSPTVVKEWKRFLDRTLESPNLYYAAFDFCHMPFADNSIDVISDGGGIGNAEGDKSIALKEAYRILKPGGVLVTSTGFVNKDTFASLPLEAQSVLRSTRPDVLEDLYEDTVLAGFRKIDSVVNGCWNTDDDDSAIADLAKSLGINLTFTSYIRYCYK